MRRNKQLYYNQDFANALLENKNLINTELHQTNLVLHTNYVFTDSNNMLTLYILQGKSGESYLCDIGSILDIADDLDLPAKVVKANATKFGLKVEGVKIYCTADINQINDQLQNFIDFVKHLGLI